MPACEQTLKDVIGQLDKILFDDYIKRKASALGRIIHEGVLGGKIDWFTAPKPTGESLLGA